MSIASTIEDSLYYGYCMLLCLTELLVLHRLNNFLKYEKMVLLIQRHNNNNKQREKTTTNLDFVNTLTKTQN